MPAPWEQNYAQPPQRGPWDNYAPASAGPGEQIQPAGSTVVNGPSWKDLGVGVLKEIPQLAHGVGSAENAVISHIPGVKDSAYARNFGAGLDVLQNAAKPANMTQSIGKGIGEAGSYLLPAAAEERAVMAAPRVLRPAARILTGALSGGAMNAANGGDFKTGAATGLGTGVIGEGAKMIAPQLVRTLGKGIDTASARAALEDTSAVKPGPLEDQLNSRIGNLSAEFNRNATGQPYQMAAPRAEVRQMVKEANFANSPQQQKMVLAASAPLFSEFKNGRFAGGLAPEIDAVRARSIKQAVGHTVNSFGPENKSVGNAIKRRLYGTINQELHRVVPGGPELDARMSQLIPVRDALSVINDREPSITGNVMGRVGARTGALTAAMAGGAAGAKRGLPGIIAGMGAGLIAPEALSAPTAKMVMARGLNSAWSPRVARAILTPEIQKFVNTLRQKGTGGQP